MRSGEEHSSTDTLQRVRAIPGARHLARVDEYVYKPDIDPSKKNAYAMVIGLRAGAPLRAIGEVDYESARVVAGRSLGREDEDADVAIVGRLYARQRLAIDDPAELARGDRRLALGGRTFRVIGIYTTANDFGDNHVFIPIMECRKGSPGSSSAPTRLSTCPGLRRSCAPTSAASPTSSVRRRSRSSRARQPGR